MKTLLTLFLTFARIGVMTFGGGYAMLPILQREVVDTKKWVTNEELMDYYAIGQTTPGIIAINTATFIGRKNKGILGGIFATLGVVFPSLIIISIVAFSLANFSDSTILQSALAGIRVSVYILILQAVIKLSKTAIIDKVGVAIFILVFSFASFTTLSPVYYIVLAGFIGFAAQRHFHSKEVN